METQPQYRRVFKRGVQELLRLSRLIKNIKSYDRTLVEASLNRLLVRLSSPGKGVILMNMGVCDALIPLLTLKSSKKQVLITLSLNILTVLSLTGAEFLDVAVNPFFCNLMHDFLKSKPTEQKLASRIICNMFKQLPVAEATMMNSPDALNLLVMTLRLPFMSSVVMSLTVLDELTYHSDNVKKLVVQYGIENELCFLGILEEFVLSDQEDIQRITLQILLNCLSFVDDTDIRDSVLHHSLHVEGMLVPLFQSDMKLIKELLAGAVRSPQHASSRSSVSRRASSMYGRQGSAVASKPYNPSGRELVIDISTPRRIPPAMKVMAVSRRHQTTLEIIWILSRLHGKVKGSNRSQSSNRGIAIHPEDTYAVLAEHICGDV